MYVCMYGGYLHKAITCRGMAVYNMYVHDLIKFNRIYKDV